MFAESKVHVKVSVIFLVKDQIFEPHLFQSAIVIIASFSYRRASD